ncbi:phospholipase D-like domain-containing protein [Empedobacter falsenii]
METIIKNTDKLNTGVFIQNQDKTEFKPLKDYQHIFLTQEGNIELKNEILKIINEAETVLKICSFIITDKEIYNAILEKAKENKVAIFILTQLDDSKLVNVSSLLDFVTEEEVKENPSQIHLKYIKKLYENGIHVKASLSAHSKFLVADRNKGFITSANFTNPSLNLNTESGVYLDTNSSKDLDQLFDVIFLQGTAYKQFIGSKRKNKMFVVQSETKINSNWLPKSDNSNLRYTCEDLSNNLIEEILHIINDANNYLYLSTYSIVGLQNIQVFVDAIKNAINRGVAINIFCRGMNYRNDHLESVLKLHQMGCKIYADMYNHSKGIINENIGMIFTANIDGNHGLNNGFEVGHILNENQRIEFLDFHKKLIKTSCYKFVENPTIEDLFITYIQYEIQKGINSPFLSEELIIINSSNIKINFNSAIIFYGKNKTSHYLIIGNNFYKCKLEDNIFQILEKTSPKYDLEKYILKFKELKIKEKI